MTLLLAALVMLGAGVFGMLGLGGGVFYVPLFTWWGMDFREQAVPASLFLGCLTGAFPVAHYLRARLVDLRTGVAAVASALLGAPLGTLALRHLPVPALKLMFACAVLLTATRILLSREPHPHQRASASFTAVAALLAGIFAGFTSGLLGIGGGFVMLPVLLGLGFPTREAVATSSLVVAFSAAAAFLAHLPAARLDWPQLLFLGAAAAGGGSFAGWFVTRHARPRILRLVVGVALLLIAARIVWEGVRGQAWRG